MSRKQSDPFDRECQICGGKIWGKGQTVLLEGAKITVCQSCAQNGLIIHDKPKKKYQKTSPNRQNKPAQRRYPPSSVDENIEIVTDYANRIRNARESRGLNQDQFAQKLNEKPSLLRRIETNKAKPTLKLAKKIEEVYKIKLLEQTDTVETRDLNDKYMKKSSGTSLGDIAFIKKKKK